MATDRNLIERTARGIAASATTSPTPPGQDEPSQRRADAEHIEAINQVFALFRLNYHNQYYAAFPDSEQLGQIKKLWLESLADYPVEQILRGARYAIENSEYLPTLNRMHSACRQSLEEFGLPEARGAYVEACKSHPPRSAQDWSHPAVYLAGRDSDWFFLDNNPEQATWPVFRDNYRHYCERVLRGETLSIPRSRSIEREAPRPMDRQELHERLQRLRKETGL